MKKLKLFAICALVLAAMLSTSVAMLIPVGAETAPEAQIGTIKYETLEGAVAAAQSGDVIELLSNVTLEDGAVSGKSAGLVIDKSLTINGNNNTIFNNNQRGIYMLGGADEQSKVILVFNDVTVYNHTEVDSVRCFDVRGGHLDLTLNNVKIDAANKSSAVAQPLTFGGDASNTFPVTVTLTNCEVRSGVARSTDATANGYDEELGFAPGHYGYAVYACNPVTLTATNTKFDAWAAIYLGSPNGSYGSKTSTVTLDGCEVIATNDHSYSDSNSFGAFVIEDADCTLNIKDTAVSVRTRYEDIPAQPIVLLNRYEGRQATDATVSISGDTVVTGVKDSTRLVWDETEPAEGDTSTGNAVQISGGTFDVAVPDEYCASGYVVTARPDGKGGTVYGAAKTSSAKSSVTALLTAKKNELYKNNRYTDENKAKIESLYATAKVTVEAATTGSVMNKAVEDFVAAAAAVQTIPMDTIKTEALAKLEASQAEYEKRKADYSDEAYAKIVKAYEDAKSAVEGATAPETVEIAVATFNDTAFGVATNKPMLQIEKPEKAQEANVWLIVGIAGGAVVLLALVAVVVAVILKKKKTPVVAVVTEKKPVVAKPTELTDAQRAAMEAERRKAEKNAAIEAAPCVEVAPAPVEEVVEQPVEVVKKTAEAVVEEIVEEAAEPAPAAEEPTAVSDEKKALFDAFAAIADKSFTERLDSVDPEIKAFYEQVREELLSYDKVKSRLSQKGESFRVGRVLLAKIAISGKTVKCYLALDPTAYDVKTYRHADASERKAFADVPMLVRIRSKLSVKRTAQLIADLAAKNGLVKK